MAVGSGVLSFGGSGSGSRVRLQGTTSLAAGSVIGRSVGIMPSSFDDFLVVPNMWGAVVARAEVAGEQKPGEAHDAQRGLTPQEELLARSCRLFLEALPDGPRSVEVAFKLGRLEYVSGNLDAARQHLSWIALAHPEHELAEYAANLVLDIANLRKDYASVHEWALRFLDDKRLRRTATCRPT